MYCSRCFESDLPFRTRLANKKGLTFPKCDPGLFPNFICEACQVRSHLGRELVYQDSDVILLMLERQRQLDTMHKWAEGTIGQYNGHYRRLKVFQDTFGVATLCPTPLMGPPTSPAIPIMWCQLWYSIQISQKTGHPITYNTSRQIRSAAGLYYSWDTQQAYPGQAVKAFDNRTVVLPHTIPTDELCYTLQAGGMARRMGTNVEPSWALQWKHVNYIDQQLELAWNSTLDPLALNEIAAAGAANVMLYSTWLRGGEHFSVCRSDVTMNDPTTGPRFGLPMGIGHIGTKLDPVTKSSPTAQADVVCAWTLHSGISPGKWLSRLLSFPSCSTEGYLFSTPQKKQWTSRHFREKYVWRFLEDMRSKGEPSLMMFTDEPGHRIRDKVWSCHSYRRCGESVVSKFRPGINARKATKVEMNEHARWSKKNKGKEPMSIHYRQLDLEDRLMITLLCK